MCGEFICPCLFGVFCLVLGCCGFFPHLFCLFVIVWFGLGFVGWFVWFFIVWFGLCLVLVVVFFSSNMLVLLQTLLKDMAGSPKDVLKFPKSPFCKFTLYFLYCTWVRKGKDKK